MEHRNSLLPGIQLGKFKIESILGHGGFGITYKALDTGLQRLVAIKEYLPQELALREADATVVAKSTKDNEAFLWGLERFMDEARTLAKFQHQNIVQVYESFEANKTGYMVMAYIEGETLGDRLDRMGEGDRMGEQEVLEWLHPLLDGLQAAHAEGIIHRDLKPDNIYIRNDGTPMLIDFGSARYALGGHSKSLSVVLTPGYAPNEQYSSSGNQGPWTDIYALGATLYRCIVGKNPIEAPERAQALINDEDDPMPLLGNLVQNYSKGLLNAIDAALEIREKDRPPGVTQFRQFLEDDDTVKTATRKTLAPGRISRRVSTIEPAPFSKKSIWIIGGVFLMFICIGAGLYFWKKLPSKDDKEHLVKETVTKSPEKQLPEEKIPQPTIVESLPEVETKPVPQPQPIPEKQREASENIDTAESAREKYQPGETFRDCGHCPEMVVVPAGEFLLGSPESDSDRNPNEGPQIKIKFRKPFAISKNEITFNDWQYCLDIGGCNKQQPLDAGFGKGDRPVINVSWHEAKQFTRDLSNAMGKRYRLPSEAEWEYAARGGASTRYAWGDVVGYNNAVCEDCGSKWDGKSTAPVGFFQENGFGLNDMHGNVMEWVEDCNEDTYFGYSKAGSARSTLDCPKRIVRGGHWSARAANIRSAFRYPISPLTHSKYVGFRVVRELY